MISQFAVQCAQNIAAEIGQGRTPSHNELVAMVVALGGNVSCVNLSAEKLNHYILILLIANM